LGGGMDRMAGKMRCIKIPIDRYSGIGLLMLFFVASIIITYKSMTNITVSKIRSSIIFLYLSEKFHKPQY
jgi:hypothetical protein